MKILHSELNIFYFIVWLLLLLYTKSLDEVNVGLWGNYDVFEPLNNYLVEYRVKINQEMWEL